ncbi:MAG: T9SS type A sorting domain-containing protein [Crocinitomicaceae bacterium]
MKRKLIIVCSLLLLGANSFAQQGDGGLPRGSELKASIEARTFAAPNVDLLRIEDAIVDENKTGPWRFGYNNTTNLNMSNSGTWTVLQNGGKVWQLKLVCQNALTVNLTLDNVVIPEGNELYVYNENKDFILGKFTSYHLSNGELGTELVPGNTAIIEYYVAPKNKDLIAQLNINTVTHGYRTATEFQEKAFGNSGGCNMNANCSDANPWDLQRRSAIMLVSGSNGFCSAALINNTLNDGKPYVLTANHCYSNPTSWIFRFNWQISPENMNQSNCSQNPGGNPTFTSLSGGVLRARRTPSDFCLVEITAGLIAGTVPNSYGSYFAGWDNSDSIPTSAVCFHFPKGDIKKAAFDDAPLVSGNGMFSSENDSQWEVEWDRNTTTEGGSSGSPLFDQNGRIIGQLWGGGASCSNLSAPDFYGKVSYSWNPSGSNSTNQLKFWLDPNDDGLTVLDGFNPTASLKENQLLDFKLYPNPSNGTFTIELPQEYTVNSDIIVLDLAGRTLHSAVYSSKSFDLNLSNLSSGNYILKIVNNEKFITKNISIQHN